MANNPAYPQGDKDRKPGDQNQNPNQNQNQNQRPNPGQQGGQSSPHDQAGKTSDERKPGTDTPAR